MTAFDSLAKTSRRAFFAVPAALAGLFLFKLGRERKLPPAEADGSGSPVELVLFSDHGERLGARTVRQLVLSDAEWQTELSSDEYKVTRKGATEPPFTGKYWNNHKAGLYRCGCCGNGVFRSSEKFDSDTGWPSFWAPAAKENIATRKDVSLAEERAEVLCAKCNAHLGHVFQDGPAPTGLRYCLNSVALRFVDADVVRR